MFTMLISKTDISAWPRKYCGATMPSIHIQTRSCYGDCHKWQWKPLSLSQNRNLRSGISFHILEKTLDFGNRTRDSSEYANELF